MSDWNTQIIEEFRANDGKVGGMFAGAPLLILHTTGAKSGAQRVSPVMYQDLDGAYAVFASKAGAPSHPDWYYNVVANPTVSIELGTATTTGIARVADAAERGPIWERQKATYPQFAEYEAKTDREIPVIIVEPS